ncbi:MAG TPA: DUF2171 domain-containing protein [Sphingomicrobium sp.]|nr:DUF2171 domain-containing protein [Sphingomicrobium sp.]
MAYDRYETRRGWREPRSRFGEDFRERNEDRYRRGSDRDFEGGDERGFFERAGDEVASWFGDEEAERRRREDYRHRGDVRGEDDSWRRSGSFMGDEDAGRYDRQARFRDEGYRRPYTGRFSGRRFGGGGEDRLDRGSPPERGWSEKWERSPQREFGQREFTGTASGLHDPHYSEWRRRQIDALDRDYDEYRRENQNRFENEFSGWRQTREGKRQMLGNVREHMSVVGSDEQEIGKVDCVRGDHIVLTKGDSEDGRHHQVSCARVDRVEGDRIILDQTADEARRHFQTQGRDRGFFRDEGERETGPHMLNRSFSGTYER